MQIAPSLLASACICAATRGVNAPSAPFALRDVCRLTQVDPLDVEFTVRHIEAVVAKETAAIQKQQQQQQQLQLQQQQCQKQYMMADSVLMSGKEMSVDDDLICDLTQPETPTDVQDVEF